MYSKRSIYMSNQPIQNTFVKKCIKIQNTFLGFQTKYGYIIHSSQQVVRVHSVCIAIRPITSEKAQLRKEKKEKGSANDRSCSNTTTLVHIYQRKKEA